MTDSRVSRFSAEVLQTAEVPPRSVSRLAAETLTAPNPDRRIAQASLEVLVLPGLAPGVTVERWNGAEREAAVLIGRYTEQGTVHPGVILGRWNGTDIEHVG